MKRAYLKDKLFKIQRRWRKRKAPKETGGMCQFFDGPNESISRIQGWYKIESYDIATSKIRFWNAESIGSSNFSEKWATERRFANEYSDIVVATYDVFDKGIIFMAWWPEGKEGEGYGLAIKENEKWRVMKQDESFKEDFESSEFGDGQIKVTRVILKLINNRTATITVKLLISRD